jgi:hypothetical protein
MTSAWVTAALHVTEADPPPSNGRRGACRISGVLVFDDLPPREIVTTQRPPVRKWPLPGDQLPAVVRLAAEDVSVRWRRLPPRERLDITTAQALPLTEEGPPRYRVDVIGDHGRPLPGSPGGGATPQEATGLIAHGEPATAVVLAVTDVAAPWLLRVLRFPVPPAGVVDLLIEVTRADNSTYQARMRIGFGTWERRERVATVGVSLPVRIDPAEPDKVAVDTGAFEWD